MARRNLFDTEDYDTIDGLCSDGIGAIINAADASTPDQKRDKLAPLFRLREKINAARNRAGNGSTKPAPKPRTSKKSPKPEPEATE